MLKKLFQNIVLILCFASISETQYIKNNFYNPPNGIQLNDTLFIDKTEVANIHYLEYLHYIKQDTLSILKGQDYLNDSLYYLYLKNNKDSLSQVALIQENMSYKRSLKCVILFIKLIYLKINMIFF